MKHTRTLRAIATLTLSLAVFSTVQADVAPLITPTPTPTPPAIAVDRKQALTTMRINAALLQLQAAVRTAYTVIVTQAYANPLGLTYDQVTAGLGTDKTASLLSAQQWLLQVNTYAPDTLPTPTPTPAP